VLVRSAPVDVPVALLLGALLAALGVVFVRRGLRDLAPVAIGAAAPPAADRAPRESSAGQGAP